MKVYKKHHTLFVAGIITEGPLKGVAFILLCWLPLIGFNNVEAYVVKILGVAATIL